MHPKNLHQSRYDLASLVKNTPELKPFIVLNPLQQETIDFTNSKAVKVLNQAILKTLYGIHFWDFPDEFLCPPIPGRADYIHYLADLMADRKECKGLDIGTGANCIYPLIGQSLYGWTFTGAEVNPIAFKSAQKIISQNNLSHLIEIRAQKDPLHIFQGILKEGEKYDFSMCNPPFHASAEVAQEGTKRKWKNLNRKKDVLNFGGKSHELWCEGGEKAFIIRMITESIQFKENINWFTSLVSKESNLPAIYSALKKIAPSQIKTIPMQQGQKKSRIIAWSFFSSQRYPF